MSDFKLTLTNEAQPTLSDTPYRCKFHYYAKTPDDFVEVVIKKTKEVVIRCRYCEIEKKENKQRLKKEWQNEKQRITPYYVRRLFAMGKNRIPMETVPDSLIEAKTAVIKLKRMTEPLKKCSEHGELYLEDVIKAGKSKQGVQWYKCRKCMKKMHAKHYELHKAKVLAKHAIYRAENRDKVNLSKRISKKKMRMHYLNSSQLYEAEFRHKIDKERARKHDLAIKDRQELTDSYVKRKLKQRTDLTSADLTPELIEIKRVVMMLKRGVRRKRDEEISNYIKETLNGKK